jgi:hypothetical protein
MWGIRGARQWRTIGGNGMKKRSAIKNDLFASHQREGQINHLGDLLAGTSD